MLETVPSNCVDRFPPLLKVSFVFVNVIVMTVSSILGKNIARIFVNVSSSVPILHFIMEEILVCHRSLSYLFALTRFAALAV